MADPGFPLNCPYCRDRLVYERSAGDTLYYRCERDGELMLPPDGILRHATPAQQPRGPRPEQVPPRSIHRRITRGRR